MTNEQIRQAMRIAAEIADRIEQDHGDWPGMDVHGTTVTVNGFVVRDRMTGNEFEVRVTAR